MFSIDDNMFKLAKMQEALLKVDNINKSENLSNYKKTVSEIDLQAFSSVLAAVKCIDEHNHSLEEELAYLSNIVDSYNHLLELQLGFKRICEVYGNCELELSDLSTLNIDYIENRINAISGYLINIKNIESNKEILQNLSNRLVDEEKKKQDLEQRLLELENILRNSFLSVEGRCIIDGKLQNISILSEYERLGFDFNKLLNESDVLDELLAASELDKKEASEKLRVAEVCYNSDLSTENKQILNEINTEYLNIEYKVIMLKILSLLSQDIDNYDLFIKKRENIIALINARQGCIEKLGFNFSVDPFNNTKVKEQLESVLLMKNNVNIISKIKKDISDLSIRTDEMLEQNNVYLNILNNTKTLMSSGLIDDVDDVDDVILSHSINVSTDVLDNQVVGIKEIPSTLNMGYVSQKTKGVITRVNQMINGISTEPVVLDEPSIVEDSVLDDFSGYDSENYSAIVEDAAIEEDIFESVDEKSVFVESRSLKSDLDLFTTVIPFEEPVMFVDKVDNIQGKRDEEKDNNFSFETLNFKEDAIFNLGEENVAPDKNNSSSDEIEMPEAFWVTQNEDTQEEITMPSFDEQIDVLLSEEKTSGKVRKKIA